MRTGSLREFIARDLRPADSMAPLSIRRELSEKYGQAAVAELTELLQESDARLFSESVLGLAQRLEQAGRVEAAADLYAGLAAEGNDLLQGRAQRELDALQGKGGFGMHSEILLRRFAKDATHPSSILAMCAAGLAFRLTRAATLSRLAASPAGIFSRGLGLRAGGALAGFGAETLSFTLVGKGAASWFGEKVDFSPQAFGRDWAAGALTLGALKGMGALTQAGVRRWAAGEGNFAGVTRSVAPQAGMFGGILLGQGLQESLGWKESPSGTGRLLDAFATLIHFKVGGALAGRLLGKKFQGLEGRLDLYSENISRGDPHSQGLGREMVFSAGGRGMLTAGGLSEISGIPRPLMSQGGRGEGGALGPGSFRIVKQMESKLSRGSILLDLATREASISRGMIHHMYSLEDAFTSLLHNYRTKETSLLKGPLVAMLREDATLRKFLLEHGSVPGKRLWAFLDADTGELQRVVALAEGNLPRSILFWSPEAGAAGTRPDLSPVTSIDLGHHRPNLPFLMSRLYFWDAKQKSLRVEEQVPLPLYNELKIEEAYQTDRESELAAAERLTVRLFPSTAQELRFEISKARPGAWSLNDAQGKLLFAMRREGARGGHFFEYSELAPPLPLPSTRVEKTEPKPAAAKVLPLERVEKGRKPVQPPVEKNFVLGEALKVEPKAKPELKLKAEPVAPPQTVESKGLQEARGLLAELQSPAGETPQGMKQGLAKLRVQMRMLTRPELDSFVRDLETQTQIFFRLKTPGTEFLSRELARLPDSLRLRLLSALTIHLADNLPPNRSLSFDIFRNAVPRLNGMDLHALQKVLEEKFPAGSLTADRRQMVDQVRILIREALNSKGPGSVPPAATLALLAGLGTLLQSGSAEAAPSEFLLSVAGSAVSTPTLGAAMLAGLLTFALRSPAARQLGQVALTLGSAVLSRLGGQRIPIYLSRQGSYPYELLLPELHSLLRKGAEAVIARREGRELSLHTQWVAKDDPTRFNFRVQEGDRHGIAVIRIKPDGIYLQNIDIPRLRAGAGTMVIDWLATQAALRGMSFHIEDTHNPQIFRILNRERIFLPGTGEAAGKYHHPETAQELSLRAPIEDPFFQIGHNGAAFHITGRLNHARLPFYLRPGSIFQPEFPKNGG